MWKLFQFDRGSWFSKEFSTTLIHFWKIFRASSFIFRKEEKLQSDDHFPFNSDQIETAVNWKEIVSLEMNTCGTNTWTEQKKWSQINWLNFDSHVEIRLSKNSLVNIIDSRDTLIKPWKVLVSVH